MNNETKYLFKVLCVCVCVCVCGADQGKYTHYTEKTNKINSHFGSRIFDKVSLNPLAPEPRS